jgi:hypothetical protein
MAASKPDRTNGPNGMPQTPEHAEPPPLRNDDIPARAGERTTETVPKSLNAEAIPDDIPARAGERADEEGE